VWGTILYVQLGGVPLSPLHSIVESNMSETKYTRELLEPLIKKHISLSDVLRELGVRLNGGSHSHICRVVKKLGIDTSHFKYGASVEKVRERIGPEQLEQVCKDNVSMAGVLRSLGFNPQSGQPRRVISRLIKEYGLDTSHFTGQIWNKGSKMPIGKGGKKDPRHFLVLRDELDRRVNGGILKQALLEIGRPYVCEYCGQGPNWNGQILVLEVDHKNGKFWDNREDNLAIACPNCHSQLPTFGIRNVEYKNSLGV